MPSIEFVHIGHETVAQRLIDGVQPLTQSQRNSAAIAKRAAAPLTAPKAQKSNAGGMFDTDARAQINLF